MNSPDPSPSPPGDPRPALVQLLRRRLAYALEADPARLDVLLRSIAHAVARRGATTLDAVVVDGALRVALPGRLPARPARLDQAAAALGLRVRFERGDEVAPPVLDPGRRARDELVRAVRFHAARVASRWQGALDDEDPEEVHALRGSLRRLKAALWIIEEDAFDPDLRALARWARALSPLTGALRDLDVALALLPSFAPDAATLAHARASLLAARAAARDAVCAHLRRAEVTAVLRAGLAAAPDLDAPRGSMRRVARHAVARALSRLERSLDGDLRQPEAWHCIRRRARRVRDLVEVTDGALGKADRRWRPQLHGLQGLLGELHDVDVLDAFTREGGGSLAGLRDAVARRREARMESLGAPLAELDAALRAR